MQKYMSTYIYVYVYILIYICVYIHIYIYWYYYGLGESRGCCRDIFILGGSWGVLGSLGGSGKAQKHRSFKLKFCNK